MLTQSQARIQTSAEPQRVERRKVPIPILLISATTMGAADTLYTVGDDRAFDLSRLSVCNNSGSAATLSAHIVPSGGSAAAGNIVLSQYSIAARDTVDLSEILGGFYDEGTVIEVYASTADVLTAHGAGEDVF